MSDEDSAVAGLGEGFASGTAPAGGTTLHYVRGGRGPAMVLIHGCPQDWYEWRHVMPRLAESFTVVAVDLRGVGGSEATEGGYDAAQMADDVHGRSRHYDCSPSAGPGPGSAATVRQRLPDLLTSERASETMAAKTYRLRGCDFSNYR